MRLSYNEKQHGVGLPGSSPGSPTYGGMAEMVYARSNTGGPQNQYGTHLARVRSLSNQALPQKFSMPPRLRGHLEHQHVFTRKVPVGIRVGPPFTLCGPMVQRIERSCSGLKGW
jgi:hypothetical protein